MKQQLFVWLANLGIEVPVYKFDKKKKQVTIKVSDVPKKLARSAGINKQEFATYWVGKNTGGNKLVKSKEQKRIENRAKKAYGKVSIPDDAKLAWVSMENKHGWSLGLEFKGRVIWLRHVRFASLKGAQSVFKAGKVYVHLKNKKK